MAQPDSAHKKSLTGYAYCFKKQTNVESVSYIKT